MTSCRICVISDECSDEKKYLVARENIGPMSWKYGSNAVSSCKNYWRPIFSQNGPEQASMVNKKFTDTTANVKKNTTITAITDWKKARNSDWEPTRRTLTWDVQQTRRRVGKKKKNLLQKNLLRSKQVLLETEAIKQTKKISRKILRDHSGQRPIQYWEKYWTICLPDFSYWLSEI